MKEKIRDCKKIFKLIKSFRKVFQGRIHEINLIVPGFLKNLGSISIVIYYVLNKSFFYTQLAFAFLS